MAIEVFNRYENKYMIDDKTFNKIQDELLKYMDIDEYNKEKDFYTIENVYYDTKDNDIIRNSLDKPLYKEKLRIRGYGQISLDSKIYIEIKKKFNGIVNKRRSTIKLQDAYKFINDKKIEKIEENMNRQVIKEIEYFISRYDLKPAMYLAYDRRAYFGKNDSDIRISFDKNIRYRKEDVSLELGPYGEKLLEEGKILMEIKVANSMPMFLTKILSENKIYPTSFSKYGAAYKITNKNTVTRKVKEEILIREEININTGYLVKTA